MPIFTTVLNSSFISTLPRMNGVLLRHLLVLLHKISSHSQENMMTASNLAICVGPSVLWSPDAPSVMDAKHSKDVSRLFQVLIEECESIYGTDQVPPLFRDDQTAAAEASANAISEEMTPKSKAIKKSSYLLHEYLVLVNIYVECYMYMYHLYVPTAYVRTTCETL